LLSRAQINHIKSTIQPWYDGRSAAANPPSIPTRLTPFNFQSSFEQHYLTIGDDDRSPSQSWF
jgi:hypothetical protein